MNFTYRLVLDQRVYILNTPQVPVQNAKNICCSNKSQLEGHALFDNRGEGWKF